MQTAPARRYEAAEDVARAGTEQKPLSQPSPVPASLALSAHSERRAGGETDRASARTPGPKRRLTGPARPTPPLQALAPAACMRPELLGGPALTSSGA